MIAWSGLPRHITTGVPDLLGPRQRRCRRACAVAALTAGVLLVLAAPAAAHVGNPGGGSGSLFQPGSPTGLTATAVSDSEVNLSWTVPDSSVAGYNIYDGTSSNGESSTPVNSDIVTGTTFSVTGLSSGTTYYFYVTAVDRANNESDPSDEAQVTTRPARAQQGSPVGPGAPAGPTGNSSKPWQTIVPLAIIPLVIGGAALMVRRRRRSRSASVPQPHTQASPGPGIHAGAGSSIQAVPHVGPPGVVSIHATGTEAMYTVRIEPHPGSASIAIEEAPRR